MGTYRLKILLWEQKHLKRKTEQKQSKYKEKNLKKGLTARIQSKQKEK